jgi:hypothetical protein
MLRARRALVSATLSQGMPQPLGVQGDDPFEVAKAVEFLDQALLPRLSSLSRAKSSSMGPAFAMASTVRCLGRSGSQRRATTMRMPGSGRSVTYGVGVTRWPGRSVSRQRWAIVARTSTASIIANAFPMHCRGPPPKGK